MTAECGPLCCEGLAESVVMDLGWCSTAAQSRAGESQFSLLRNDSLISSSGGGFPTHNRPLQGTGETEGLGNEEKPLQQL